MTAPKRYGVRTREGVREVVWIELVRNGFWRGVRLPDGTPTRGPIAALVGRFATHEDATALLGASA